ncbi:lysylphosphatidylglycerol synthase transmembrane domain-containing protein [Candidatus Aenigmatarchaeota archaeon]
MLKRIKKNLTVVGFFLLGIVLTAVIMSFFGFYEVLGMLLRANMYYVGLAIALHIVTVLILTWRLHIIVRKYKPLSWRKAFRVTFTGLFVNYITPVMKVGGEPVKIYLLNKDLGGSKATATIAIDTFVEIMSSYISFFLIFVLFFPLLPEELFIYYVLFLIGVLASSLAFLKISLTHRWLKKIIDFGMNKASRFIKIEKKDYASMFHESFRILLKDKKTMMYSLSVSLLGKVFEFLRMYVVFLALGLVLPWSVVIVVWAFLLILYIIPWLPGGLGLIEGGLAFAFVTLGVPSAIAASGAILDRIITFWLIIFVGIVLVSFYAWELKGIKNEIKRK